MLNLLTACSITHAFNIHGIVTNTDGVPLSEAVVSLEKLGKTSTTDANGLFTLSGTAIKGNKKINTVVMDGVSVTLQNDLLRLVLGHSAIVEITSYTVQGRAVSMIQQKMDAGTHTLTLPQRGSGVYLYRIKTGDREVVVKTALMRSVAAGCDALSKKEMISNTLEEQATVSAEINDVIIVIKDGYLNYQVAAKIIEEDSIQIKMITCADTVRDADGNLYHAVRIGQQVWTVENLRTTLYNDSTPITKDSTTWGKDSLPEFCYYRNTTNADSIVKFGALYNWYVLKTGKLAPAGWHVPEAFEWDTLKYYLIANGYNWDSTTQYDKTAKSLAAKTDWAGSWAAGAIGNDLTRNNRSGFSALPGGWCEYDGGFSSIGTTGFWWSATESDATHGFNRNLGYDFETFFWNYSNYKIMGLSVRLVKD